MIMQSDWFLARSVFLYISAYGHGNAFVSCRVHPYLRCHFSQMFLFFRLGSTFKQTRRSLPQADKSVIDPLFSLSLKSLWLTEKYWFQNELL